MGSKLKVILSFLVFSISVFATTGGKRDFLTKKCIQQLELIGPGSGFIYQADLKAAKKEHNVGPVRWFWRWTCPGGNCGTENNFKPDRDGHVQCSRCGEAPDESVNKIEYVHDGKALIHSDDLARTKEELLLATTPNNRQLVQLELPKDRLRADRPERHDVAELGPTVKRAPKELPDREMIPEEMPTVSGSEFWRRVNDHFTEPIKARVGSSYSNWKEYLHKNPKLKLGLKIALGALGVGALAAVVSNAVGSHEVDGEVTELDWDKWWEVEAFTLVTRSDWRSNIVESLPWMPVNGQGERPGAFNIRNCRQEVHHYDQVFSHYREEVYYVPDDPSPSWSTSNSDSDWGSSSSGSSDWGSSSSGASDYGSGGGFDDD